MKPLPPLATTAIGSVPFLDVNRSLDLVAETCPLVPHWPQLVNWHPREDMILQAADNLPLLQVDEKERRILVRDQGREQALTDFYEHFLTNDLDYFAVTPQAEVGLTALLQKAQGDPGFGPDFLKAQLSGPITFGQAIRTADGKTLLDDPELADTVVKGLGAKAAWLAGRIRALGRQPVVFLDEPGLTGFGSAFSTLDRAKVIEMLSESADLARAAGPVYIGTHVCGNTDWGMLTETTIDIISFDAFEFLDHFLLYPEKIRAFLDRGGYVAWGIVPARGFTGRETAPMLADKLKDGWRRLADRGMDLNLIKDRALITPACGTGTLPEETALRIYRLLPQVADLVRG
jgi:hypothetical protein